MFVKRRHRTINDILSDRAAGAAGFVVLRRLSLIRRQSCDQKALIIDWSESSQAELRAWSNCTRFRSDKGTGAEKRSINPVQSTLTFPPANMIASKSFFSSASN